MPVTGSVNAPPVSAFAGRGQRGIAGRGAEGQSLTVTAAPATVSV